MANWKRINFESSRISDTPYARANINGLSFNIAACDKIDQLSYDKLALFKDEESRDYMLSPEDSGELTIKKPCSNKASGYYVKGASVGKELGLHQKYHVYFTTGGILLSPWNE